MPTELCPKKNVCGGVSDADFAQIHSLAGWQSEIAVRGRSHNFFLKASPSSNIELTTHCPKSDVVSATLFSKFLAVYAPQVFV